MNIPSWLQQPIEALDNNAIKHAQAHQNQLTKPPGSLGRLEDIAVFIKCLSAAKKPQVDSVHITIFASDHGIAAQGVSAFPQAVTAEMVRNFAHGGAAISVLAHSLNAKLNIINLGTVNQIEPLNDVQDKRIAAGTADFSQTAAMTEKQLISAVELGKNSVDDAINVGTQLFIGGEMGIANTSSATALSCALMGVSAQTMTGRGTGIDDAALEHKMCVINDALALHKSGTLTPWQCLMTFGGFEIAALTGAYIRCAQKGLPVLVDGFISSTAALAAAKLCDGVAPRLIFAHASAEVGHQHILTALNAKPLLDLGLRLGEASGAAIAVPLIRMACDLHNKMASFADAGVSEAL